MEGGENPCSETGIFILIHFKKYLEHFSYNCAYIFFTSLER